LQIVKPKQLRLAEAELALKDMEDALESKRNHLDQINMEVNTCLTFVKPSSANRAVHSGWQSSLFASEAKLL
jgi:hypothetical protein